MDVDATGQNSSLYGSVLLLAFYIIDIHRYCRQLLN